MPYEERRSSIVDLIILSKIAFAHPLRFNASLGASAVMKIFIWAAFVLVLPLCGWAAADATKSCVLKATEALPKIPGLKVKKSGTRSMSPEQLGSWQGQSRPIIVDLDTDRPGIIERYSYICARSPSGAAFVRRILD
jgi:hypothetical protein